MHSMPKFEPMVLRNLFILLGAMAMMEGRVSMGVTVVMATMLIAVIPRGAPKMVGTAKMARMVTVVGMVRMAKTVAIQ